MANIDASGIKNKNLYLALGDPYYTDTLLFDLENTYITGSSFKRNKIYLKAQSSTSYGTKAEYTLNIYGNFPRDGYGYIAESAYISGLETSYKLNRNNLGTIKISDMYMSYATAYYSTPYEIEVELLSGADKIIGTKNGDQIFSLEGADKIYGRNGNDSIYGGSGNDKIYGGSGKDLIYGNSGNDYLSGGSYKDKVYGGTGKDTLRGGSSHDKLYGESGEDTLYGDTGNDYLRGGDGNDKLVGGTGNDKLRGSSNNDRLYGESGKDRLYGDSGNDRIYGGSGADKLYGGTGDDTLYGGTGDDTLYGGSGNDIFQINTSITGVGKDLITDYESISDSIEILGGAVESELTLDYVGGDTRIKYNDSILAIVQNTIAEDISFI